MQRLLAVLLCLMPIPGLAQTKPTYFTGAEAIAAARKAAGADWLLMFVSTTGVADDVSLSGEAADRLLRPDGKAGQWIIEFYKDTPKDVTQDGKKGKSYPFRRFAIGDGDKPTELPKSEMGTGSAFTPMSEACVSGLKASQELAIKNNKKKFDVLDVTSDRTKGDCSWPFQFYDTKTQDIVNHIHIAGAGNKQLPWE